MYCLKSLIVCFFKTSFLLLIGITFLVKSVTAEVFTIKDFPQREFYKQNFTYHTSSLETWKDHEREPVISLRSIKADTQRYSSTAKVQWREGISGVAPSFYGTGSELPLDGWENFFSREKLSEFTVSFYFLPRSIVREEKLIYGEQDLTTANGIIKVGFGALLRNGYVHWELDNFFRVSGRQFSKTLISRVPILPGQWNHLVLGYDMKNSRLTMFLNGEMVDFVYATVTGRKNGSKYIPGFKTSVSHRQEWTLGKNFLGMIDEINLFDRYMMIDSRFVSAQYSDTLAGFKKSQGYHSLYSSQVFRIARNARIHRVNIQGKGIDFRFVRLYLCSSKNFFPEHTQPSDCNRVLLDQEIANYPVAEFYQLFIMYDNLDHSPKQIEKIHLSYQSDMPPLPPQWVSLQQNRNGIGLEWKYTLDAVSGYRIFYRSGDFKGGKNMVQLGIRELQVYKTHRELWGYILEGLEKDQLYFFGIKSYDLLDGQIRESEFSLIKSIYYSSDFFN